MNEEMIQETTAEDDTREKETFSDVYRPTDDLLSAVREGNAYQAQEAVRRQIEQGLSGQLQDPLTEWKFYLVRILTLITFTACENRAMNRYLDSIAAQYVREIEKVEDTDACGKLLEDMVQQYCDLNRLDTKCYSTLVQKIILAVAMDLKVPLTLQYFSDRLSVNSSYLSNLFRKETGQTITDYVTEKRINHAADLLRHSQLPIKTVAKQVGIADVQYFSRLFKKKMGMTPTQYRHEPKGQEAAEE